jgi:CDP-diacylglycerol--glycerol-3-phosphate 3-phosphatidyltransferase
VTLPLGILATVVRWVGLISLVAALALTAWSGYDYFVKCWPYVVGE